MQIFLICKVRGLVPEDDEYKAQRSYVDSLEKRG